MARYAVRRGAGQRRGEGDSESLRGRLAGREGARRASGRPLRTCPAHPVGGTAAGCAVVQGTVADCQPRVQPAYQGRLFPSVLAGATAPI